MKPHASQTYDEITRRTVPEPDGSIRVVPTTAPAIQESLVLRERVADALIACGLPDIGIEVDAGRVILRGWVTNIGQAHCAVRAVNEVAPEAVIVDRMHVGRPA